MVMILWISVRASLCETMLHKIDDTNLLLSNNEPAQKF